MEKIVVRISIVDELGRCIVGKELRVTVQQWIDGVNFNKFFSDKVTQVIDKLIKGE